MNIVVCGAAGFIGWHLVKRLRDEGHRVIGIDRKRPEFEQSHASLWVHWDLRTVDIDFHWFQDVDEVYQLAADMGGAGYLFTGEHDAKVMSNNALINLKVLEACRNQKVPRVLFTSSACVYQDLRISSDWHPPDGIQEPQYTNMACAEYDAYPANPDSEYGWEKLFSERLYQAYARNYGMQTRIARLHNVYGPIGTWKGGREKFPAAVCRKVAEAAHGTEIDLWGDGQQQRSFTYIDDAVTGIIKLMRSDCPIPLNIGSSRMISIDDVARMVIAISTKWLDIQHVAGPEGVRGRNSDNTLIKDKLHWEPVYPLEMGLYHTYHWVKTQVMRERADAQIGLTPISG